MLCAVVSAGSHSTAARADETRWQSVFDTSARYYSWRNSNGGSGSQVYVPYAVQGTGRPNDDWKVELLVRSGYLWSRQSFNSNSVEASSPTDTTLGTTVTYYGLRGIQPFVSFNVSVPTANTIHGTASTTRPDSDLVATPIFGQGWGIGPSVGASMALAESWIATASFGYNYRGPFDQGPALSLSPSPLAQLGETPPAGRLKPGDVYTINTGLGYKGERLVLQLNVSYSIETTTYHDHERLYRAGDRVIAIAKAGYAWTDNWSTRASVSLSHFNRNQVPQIGLPDLVRETLNSNSDVVSATFEATYSRDNYAIGPTVGYLFRNHNGYDPVNLQFIPAKVSWSAGIAAQVAPTGTTSISLSVQHVWVHEDQNPDKVLFIVPIANSGIPETSTNAWVVMIGGTIRF